MAAELHAGRKHPPRCLRPGVLSRAWMASTLLGPVGFRDLRRGLQVRNAAAADVASALGYAAIVWVRPQKIASIGIGAPMRQLSRVRPSETPSARALVPRCSR